MVSSKPSFQNVYLSEERAAGDMKQLWRAQPNDAFFRLQTYTGNFTGVHPKGYDSREEPDGALEACHTTLDALEQVLDWMNQSPLIQLADERVASKDITWERAEKVCDDTFAHYKYKPSDSQPFGSSDGLLAMLRTLGSEFTLWVTGSERTKEGLSPLILYVAAPNDRLRITAAMRRAGDEMLKKAPPTLSKEALASEVYKAIVRAQSQSA